MLPEVSAVIPGPTNESMGINPVKKKKERIIVEILSNLVTILKI